METIRDFCTKTSIHGFSYIVNECKLISKIFWSIVSFTMISIGITFFANGVKEFFTSSMTSINTTTASMQNIYFPSVYLCNINQVSLKIFTVMYAIFDRELCSKVLNEALLFFLLLLAIGMESTSKNVHQQNLLQMEQKKLQRNEKCSQRKS